MNTYERAMQRRLQRTAGERKLLGTEAVRRLDSEVRALDTKHAAERQGVRR